MTHSAHDWAEAYRIAIRFAVLVGDLIELRGTPPRSLGGRLGSDGPERDNTEEANRE